MKAFTILLTLFALTSFTKAESLQNCATITVNYTVFNLCPFAQNDPYEVISHSKTDNVTFTLGNNHVLDCANDSKSLWAKVTSNSETTPCEVVASEDPEYSLLSTSNPSEGLVITFPRHNNTHIVTTNDTNVTVGSDYQLIVNLICSREKLTNQTVFERSEDLDLNEYITITLTGYSSYGCPVVSLGTLVDFLTSNKYLLAGIFAVIGLVLCFFGFTLLNFAIFVVTTTTSTVIICNILFQFLDLGTAQWIKWIIFLGSLLVGSILGFLAFRYQRIGYSVLGAVLGAIVGLLVYDVLIEPFIASDTIITVIFVVLMAAGVVGMNFAFHIVDKLTIISTSVIGAFLTIRSASIFIGGYPFESYVAEGFENFDWTILAYVIAMIALFAVSMYYQFENKKKKDKLDEHELEKKVLGDDINNMRL